MDFLRDECDAWYGKKRPPTQVARVVAERVALAPTRLPPHDVWLQRVVGMPDYGGSTRK